MAVTLIHTPGATDANAYADLAGANAAYFDALLASQKTAWVALSTADQDALLVQATREIEARFRFTGVPANTDQALQLPQTGLCDRNGREYASDSMPTPAVAAMSDLANQIASGEWAAPQDEASLIRNKTGPLEKEFLPHLPDVLPRSVLQRLHGLGTPRRAGSSAVIHTTAF